MHASAVAHTITATHAASAWKVVTVWIVDSSAASGPKCSHISDASGPRSLAFNESLCQVCAYILDLSSWLC